MRWTLVVDEVGHPGHHNMAIDATLLRQAGEGGAFLRLYRWKPPCLSFGRNEPAKQRYDLEEIRRLGLDTVRRPTGGRAVWHDAELTYAVAAPWDTFGTLPETFVSVHRMVAGALRALGVEASVAPRPRGRVTGVGGGACFATPVGGEIVAQGKKLVGSAQFRDGPAFLQHGSILLDNDQDVISRITRGERPTVRATSLREVIGRDLDYSTVAAVIAHHAKTIWGGCWHGRNASTFSTEGFNFEDPAWTWRR